MLNSESIPASDIQKFINRVANANLGEFLTDPKGRNVEKVSYGSLNVDGELISNEDYFATLRIPAVGGENQSEQARFQLRDWASEGSAGG